MKKVRLLLTIVFWSISLSLLAGDFTVGNKTFLLNGEPFIVKAAEVHYPRIPRPYWEHRIQMCKALGMNTLCIYVFWNIHEQREGVFDFTGNNDVAAFCRLAQKHGMYVIVRPNEREEIPRTGCGGRAGSKRKLRLQDPCLATAVAWWAFGDSNPGPTGYEPGALTN